MIVSYLHWFVLNGHMNVCFLFDFVRMLLPSPDSRIHVQAALVATDVPEDVRRSLFA